jgi:hypothetical protein
MKQNRNFGSGANITPQNKKMALARRDSNV